MHILIATERAISENFLSLHSELKPDFDKNKEKIKITTLILLGGCVFISKPLSIGHNVELRRPVRLFAQVASNAGLWVLARLVNHEPTAASTLMYGFVYADLVAFAIC